MGTLGRGTPYIFKEHSGCFVEKEVGVMWANLETEKPLRRLLCKFVGLDYLLKDIGVVLAKAGSGKWKRRDRLGCDNLLL